jgi:TIR domain
VDFFVSYAHADEWWAERIAWQLEVAGYPVSVQAWDFVAGSNWVAKNLPQHRHGATFRSTSPCSARTGPHACQTPGLLRFASAPPLHPIVRRLYRPEVDRAGASFRGEATNRRRRIRWE